MDDAYFNKLLGDFDAPKDDGVDELFERAEKRCKELYPNHAFVDIFADPSACKAGLKPMESILKEDGGWEDALKRFACHRTYSELICRVAIPKE